MKLARPSPWVVMAVVAVVSTMALLFLFAQGQRHSESSYLKNVTLLRHLKQLDAQWELSVLRSKIGIDSHYDPLADSLVKVSALFDEAESALRVQEHDEPDGLVSAGASLREAFAQRTTLIERFKSANALLRNSLMFLPTATEEARQAIGDQERPTPLLGRVSTDLNNLLLGSTLYSQNASREKVTEVQAILDRLAANRSLLPQGVGERLDIVSIHVATILREQAAVNGLLGDIAQVPTAARIDGISNALSAEQQGATMKVRRQREHLLALSTLLVGLLLYAALRLVRGHRMLRDSRDKLLEYGHSLEHKVADRVAALRQSEARMTQLAQYDSLTGLPNRNLFSDRLAQAMARANRDGHLMALMFVDLDHFKQINDSLGHVVGDGVLKAVAQRLRESLRDSDTIARLGGDEFTIIVEGLSEAGNAVQLAAKIREVLARPLMLDGRELVLSASVGVALHVRGSDDGDALLQAADIAMYRAKQNGRNAHAMFAPEMAVQISERANMVNLLRHALDRGEFELHYQPKLELDTGRVAGVEALLRWNSKELGPVSPARFVPLAEEMGLIVPIGDWALRTACRQGRAWQLEGLPPLTMAVNLSPRQLRDATLVDGISGTLRETGFSPRLLELELTEGVIMEDVKGNIDTLIAIRRLGASLAIDDFGTGYSSLAYLARLPIQTLKIDRAFVVSMLEDTNTMTLVSTMVTLAHSLSLKVVAEGVETAEQQRLLRQMHCDQIQGYHFSRPLAADAVAALIRQNAGSAAAVLHRSGALTLVGSA
jgi:diguanylate cyclase (GGDEF)-like protein